MHKNRPHRQEPIMHSGWYTSSAFTTEFNFTTPITANQTVHAKWVDVYTVTFKDGTWADCGGYHNHTSVDVE